MTRLALRRGTVVSVAYLGDVDEGRAFRALPAGMCVPGVPADRQRFAFHYGIDLHAKEHAT